MASQIKKIIDNYSLYSENNLIKFINENPENLTLSTLSRIAEITNNNRLDTAAYYTDNETLEYLHNNLPDITNEEIHILEPSVGVGNFLSTIINKYKDAKKLVIDVVDIDEKSLELVKILNKYRNIPSNVTINYFCEDFLTFSSTKNYNLTIGNPPFLKKNKISNWKTYSRNFDDYTSTNISSFFLQKCLDISDNIVLILPKYFLSNSDFENARKKANQFAIKKIIDFGEKGFKGVLIETIALIINTQNKIDTTTAISVTKNIENVQPQSQLTDSKFPNWLLYRDSFFNSITENLIMNVFEVFRDRTITNKLLNKEKGIPVIKSRNISRDGLSIISIPDYDSYISKEYLQNKSVLKYLHRTDVYLVPNMTYYPRIILKPDNCITNGSVAILELKKQYKIQKKHINFINSEVFTEFYSIARNHSTRSLNIDKNSVQYFGLYEGEDLSND